jgi:hypothetical protein
VGGQPRNRLARLANDAANQSLTLANNARVQWLRSGAAPEVEQATFEVPTNGGADWSLLGSGARIAGGWELSGLTLTGSGSLRARGRTGGGTGSSGLVESVAAFLVAPPLNIARSNAFGIISWPLTANGFVLDESLTVTGTWSQVAFPYVTNATDISISLPAPTDNKFYRLRSP